FTGAVKAAKVPVAFGRAANPGTGARARPLDRVSGGRSIRLARGPRLGATSVRNLRHTRAAGATTQPQRDGRHLWCVRSGPRRPERGAARCAADGCKVAAREAA